MLFIYLFFDILYLEVNKYFTDCKQCLLPLLWSCFHNGPKLQWDFQKQKPCPMAVATP